MNALLQLDRDVRPANMKMSAIVEEITRPWLPDASAAAVEAVATAAAIAWNLSRMDRPERTRWIDGHPLGALEPMIGAMMGMALEGWPDDDRVIASVRVIDEPEGPVIGASWAVG